MASLRQAARNVLYEAQDAIAWIVLWKEGRGWNADTVWLDYNERTHRFQDVDADDIAKLKEIYENDENAILVNGYYINIGPLDDGMTLESLVDGLRWQYEDIGGSLLKDLLEENGVIM